MSRLKDYQKIFAWTSIYLIISLTFFSANALAAINYRASGEELVNGWRKSNDVTLFYVNASANVSIQVSNGVWKPMICTMQGNNSYICEYFLDRNTLPISATNVTTTIRHETSPSTNHNVTLRVDRFAPKIEKLNITKINNALKVSYSIRDTAYLGSTLCSGLDYVSYIVGSDADIIYFNTTICTYNGTVIFNESEFYQEDFTISITAKDRLNGTVTNTTTIILDLKAPDIQDEWQIVRNGQIIEILSNNINSAMKYDVIVFIDDPKLDISKVRGDLSGLHTNTVVKNTLRNRQATCSKEGETLFKCVFADVPILPATENLQIKVNAYDTTGNFVNETLQKTITLLNDAGQVKYIGPLKEHCTTDLNSCYAKTGGQNFILEISAGSNYSLLSVSFNGNPAVALCALESEQWLCRAPYSVPIGTTQLKMHTTDSSRDIYGNKLTYVEKNIIIDTIPPTIIGNITSNLPNCAVASDTLELTMLAKEATSEVLKVYVNTTGLTTLETTNGTCEKTVNDEWACTLSIDGFVTSHPPTIRQVIVEDLAGNTGYKDFKFEVCAEDANAVPNYITKIAPENDIQLDRRTASLLPIKTYVPLTITKSSSATIIEMTVDNCFAIDPDDTTNEVSVLDSGHYFIDNTLVLYVGFNGAVLPVDEFDINCTVNSRVRVGSKVFLKPEQDSFIITAKPYNNPLGVLDSSVSTKITDQKAALRALDKEIELRKTIGGVFETICNLAQIIVKINNILQLIKSVVYTICVAFSWTGWTESIWESVGYFLNSVDITVQTYVWPTNILSGSVYGSAIKYTCLLYSCQHYKVSGLIEIGSAIVDIVDNAGVQKEKAGKAIAEEKQKQVDQVNQQKYDGKKEYYQSPDGKVHEVYIKDGKKIAGSDTIVPGAPGGTELLKYEDVQKMPESTTTTPVTVVGEDYSTYMDECMDPNCNVKDNIYYPEETDDKNTEVELNKDLKGKDQQQLEEEQKEIKRKMEEQKQLQQLELLQKQLAENQRLLQQLNQQQTQDYVFLGNKEDNGWWRNVYYTVNDDGSIQLWEEIKLSDGTSLDNMKKIQTGTFTKFDAKATADLLWRTQQTGWLANTHAGGLTYNLEGETVNGEYVIKAKKDGAIDKYSRKYSDLEFSSSKELTKFLNNEKKEGSTLVTRKSYNIKIFNGKTNSGGTSVTGGAITDITGRDFGPPEPPSDRAGGATEYDDGFSISAQEMWGDMDDANQQYYERNLKFYSALESEDWIINPYRSAHWDDLCAPAIVYNLQKEKQIRCKYVKCMETQLLGGMPSYICDRDLGMDACLYIDSAQWHVTGGHFWDNIGAGLLKSFLSTLVGLVLYTGYSAACSNYLGGMNAGGSSLVGGGGASSVPAQPAGTTTLATGWWDVSCGILGTALQWKEITALGTGDFWSSFFESDTPKDPSEINDYCADVNYNE